MQNFHAMQNKGDENHTPMRTNEILKINFGKQNLLCQLCMYMHWLGSEREERREREREKKKKDIIFIGANNCPGHSLNRLVLKEKEKM